jgi:hypothetical protein
MVSVSNDFVKYSPTNLKIITSNSLSQQRKYGFGSPAQNFIARRKAQNRRGGGGF